MLREDLLPIARNHFYHPIQEGSWSVKAILPAIAPELSYDTLGDIQHGQAASEAYLEATSPKTNTERLAQIERALLEYCKLDTLATVKIWQTFSGR